MMSWRNYTLSWLSHPRASEIWPRANALCPLSKSKRPAKEGILDMTRESAHLQQHAWGYFTFKRLMKCRDDRTLPLVEKICDSMGFRAANRLRVDKVRTCRLFFCAAFTLVLRVVPHFSSGIVEWAKRARAWKWPHARKSVSRSLPLFSLIKGVTGVTQ